MQRYEPNTPRATLGLAAVAMTAIVLGVLVILPAEMDASGHYAWVDLALTPAEAAARASDQPSMHTATSVLRCTDIRPDHAPAG